MKEIRTLQQESAEDLFFGQVVIIWARWFLIFAGITVVLWTTSEATELVRDFFPFLALMIMNFYLHGRYIVEQPANAALLMAASLLDLIIVTMIVAFWHPSGLENPFFVFYYPIVVAVGFVFPRRLTITYTTMAIVLYVGSSLLLDPSFVAGVAEQKLLVQRLITMAAMGGLGTFYWRIQRDRLRAVRDSA